MSLPLGNTKLDVGKALPVAVAVGRNARQVVKTTTSPLPGKPLPVGNAEEVTVTGVPILILELGATSLALADGKTVADSVVDTVTALPIMLLLATGGRPMELDATGGRPMELDATGGRPMELDATGGRPMELDATGGRPMDAEPLATGTETVGAAAKVTVRHVV